MISGDEVHGAKEIGSFTPDDGVSTAYTS